MQVTSAASAANASHQRRFAERIITSLGDPRGRRAALLGLAFKAGTDDVRWSPALRVAQILLKAGVVVVAHDPMASGNALRALPGLEIADSAEVALAGSDVAIIATEWPEYATLDWGAIGDTMHSAVVFDGRRLLRSANLAGLGFRYEMVGGPAAVGEQHPEPPA